MIDAEIISMLMFFFTKVGLEKLELQINSLGCKECRPKYREELKKFLEKGSLKFCEDCERRLKTNPLRIFDCKVQSCQEIIDEAPKVNDYICNECQKHFDQLKDYLKLLGLHYSVNPKMVRGLDYYTRTAFEVISNQLGSQNAVSGGGRYDNLFQEIGGIDIPGIGFAIGMERLVTLLSEGKDFLKFPHLFLAAIGERALKEAFRLSNQFHLNGIWAEMDYDGKSLKSQMRKADKLKVKYVIIIGEEEIKRKRVVLRNMEIKDQEEIPLDGIFEVVKNRIFNKNSIN
jgi:histidyl-tRNA synthetase